MAATGAHRRTGLWRALAALALIALAVQVLVPPGFMLSGASADRVQVVICTGHGPLQAADPGGARAPAQKGKAGQPCAFAGRGVLLGPALAGTAAATLIAWPVEPPQVRPRVVFVGRGLAAPPPARAPPILPI